MYVGTGEYSDSGSGVTGDFVGKVVENCGVLGSEDPGQSDGLFWIDPSATFSGVAGLEDLDEDRYLMSPDFLDLLPFRCKIPVSISLTEVIEDKAPQYSTLDAVLEVGFFLYGCERWWGVGRISLEGDSSNIIPLGGEDVGVDIVEVNGTPSTSMPASPSDFPCVPINAFNTGVFGNTYTDDPDVYVQGPIPYYTDGRTRGVGEVPNNIVAQQIQVTTTGAAMSDRTLRFENIRVFGTITVSSDDASGRDGVGAGLSCVSDTASPPNGDGTDRAITEVNITANFNDVVITASDSADSTSSMEDCPSAFKTLIASCPEPLPASICCEDPPESGCGKRLDARDILYFMRLNPVGGSGPSLGVKLALPPTTNGEHDDYLVVAEQTFGGPSGLESLELPVAEFTSDSANDESPCLPPGVGSIGAATRKSHLFGYDELGFFWLAGEETLRVLPTNDPSADTIQFRWAWRTDEVKQRGVTFEEVTGPAFTAVEARVAGTYDKTQPEGSRLSNLAGPSGSSLTGALTGFGGGSSDSFWGGTVGSALSAVREDDSPCVADFRMSATNMRSFGEVSDGTDTVRRFTCNVDIELAITNIKECEGDGFSGF